MYAYTECLAQGLARRQALSKWWFFLLLLTKHAKTYTTERSLFQSNTSPQNKDVQMHKRPHFR